MKLRDVVGSDSCVSSSVKMRVATSREEEKLISSKSKEKDFSLKRRILFAFSSENVNGTDKINFLRSAHDGGRRARDELCHRYSRGTLILLLCPKIRDEKCKWHHYDLNLEITFSWNYVHKCSYFIVCLSRENRARNIFFSFSPHEFLEASSPTKWIPCNCSAIIVLFFRFVLLLWFPNEIDAIAS